MNSEICKKCKHHLTLHSSEDYEELKFYLKCRSMDNYQVLFEFEINNKLNNSIFNDLMNSKIQVPFELNCFKNIEPDCNCVFYTEHFLDKINE